MFLRFYNKNIELKKQIESLKVGDEVMFPLGNFERKLHDKIYYGKIIRIEKSIFGNSYHVSYLDDSYGDDECIEKITVIHNDRIYKAVYNGN